MKYFYLILLSLRNKNIQLHRKNIFDLILSKRYYYGEKNYKKKKKDEKIKIKKKEKNIISRLLMIFHMYKLKNNNDKTKKM